MSLRHSTLRLFTNSSPSALSNPTTASTQQLTRWILPTLATHHQPRRYARNKPFANLSDAELQAQYRKFRAWAEETFGNAETPTYLGQFDLQKLERKKEDRMRPDEKYRIFPNNRFFKAQPVLSEEFKDEIYRRVKTEGKSVRTVSAELGVSMERVAAVVRLREIRKEMEAQGKELPTAIPNALAKLMPQTPLPTNNRPSSHEPLNTYLVPLPTGSQLFVPIPESRTLTSSEAAKLMGVPAPDELIPHPELIKLESMRSQAIGRDERMKVAKEAERKEKERAERVEKKRREWEEKCGDVIERGRWRWRLTEAKVGFVGERYGVPKEDRKKGNGKDWLECRHYAYGVY